MNDVTQAPSANGNGAAPSRSELESILTSEPLTAGYRPTLPSWALWTQDWLPQIYLLRDIELMIIHPMVRSVLEFFKGGITGAQFYGGEAPDGNPQGLPICPDSPEVEAFVHEQCQRFWDVGVPAIQGGYEYGWIGTEPIYTQDDGPLRFDHLIQFSPRDCFLLTKNKMPVGVRIKNVENKGQVDLFTASRDVPAKGLWYAHQPRYNNFYGQSQLLGAWKPWRRLAWKDAAETVLDTGFYRFAFAGPIIGFPEEDLQVAGPIGPPGTTLDSQGRPRRFARDIARQIAEQAKAGAGIGLPSTRYPSEQGGGEKWTLKWPEHVFNGAPIIEYIEYLLDQICYGIGVPPELLQASETGSGYSGRAIPMDAFIERQQCIADALLHLFVSQILRPLVRWNFGAIKFDVKVKKLLQSKMAQRELAKPQPEGTVPPEVEGGSPVGQPVKAPPGAAPMPSQGMQNRQTGPKWSPHVDQRTNEKGWVSSGGLVRMQSEMPGAGLSMSEADERIQAIAERILRASAA